VLASPVVHVEQVDFISVPTRDVARAIAWYREVLGLPESEVSDGELETPNVTLSFWEPEREDLLFAPNEAGFAIRVADVSAARAELEATSSSLRRGTRASVTSPHSATRTATPSSCIAGTHREFRAISGDARLCV
jgi:catechol 2,3-dioxygenase-like lactoylglutathione lyase family enzyme